MPAELHIGAVDLHSLEGPVWTQRTHIVQAPGWRPTYLKHMDQGPLEVADGYQLTVALLNVEVPPAEEMVAAFGRWRDECLAAVACVAVVLDERVGQEVLAEDLIAFDAGGEPRAASDTAGQVRTYASAERVLAADRPVLESLAHLDPSDESPVNAAARWYLRGAQAGQRPTPWCSSGSRWSR